MICHSKWQWSFDKTTSSSKIFGCKNHDHDQTQNEQNDENREFFTVLQTRIGSASRSGCTSCDLGLYSSWYPIRMCRFVYQWWIVQSEISFQIFFEVNSKQHNYNHNSASPTWIANGTAPRKIFACKKILTKKKKHTWFNFTIIVTSFHSFFFSLTESLPCFTVNPHDAQFISDLCSLLFLH